ncbi:MAG: diaminopimelate decarboxylase [Bacteroidetes bacterium]|nr:diaminopimelate decarboxylase [Bacteroidota bacterium]
MDLFTTKHWGNTYGYPLYIYDGNKMQTQYDRLSSAFGDHPHDIRYACKANSNLYVLKLLAEKGAHLDVVSVNEGRLGEMAGFSRDCIHFTPNGVSLDECREALDRGYSLSLDHVPSIQQLADERPGLPLCIRINPAVKAGGHEKISVGHRTSKFGLSIDQLNEVEKLHFQGAICVKGMHIHTGSDIGDVDAIKKGAQVLFEQAKAFKNSLEYLDFGGGFKVSYHDEDFAIDEKGIAEWLIRKIKDFEGYCGRPIRIVLEPGKFLVSEAGFFLAEVTQLKKTYNTTFAHLNSGFNHFIRPMYYEANHEITVLGKEGKSAFKKYSVVGYLCETDTFASDRSLPELAVGDVLVFHNAGAYAYSMASQYNQRPRPAEILMFNGAAHLIRKREVFDDLLATQLPLEGFLGS